MSDTNRAAPTEELRARRERATAALAPARAELRARLDHRAGVAQERASAEEQSRADERARVADRVRLVHPERDSATDIVRQREKENDVALAARRNAEAEIARAKTPPTPSFAASAAVQQRADAEKEHASVEKRAEARQHPGFIDGWGSNNPTRQAGQAVERAQRERLQSGAAAAELPAPRPRTLADAAAALQARPAAVPSFAASFARERSIER